MWMTDDERLWTRRLALSVVLVTCAGGGASVLVSRPHGDCVVVGDMMATYSAFQAGKLAAQIAGSATPQELLAAAGAEAETADTLHSQARDIALPALHAAAIVFADGVASSARTQRDDLQRPPELEPFDPVLPQLAPGELEAGELLSAAATVMLIACPSTPRPVGIT